MLSQWWENLRTEGRGSLCYFEVVFRRQLIKQGYYQQVVNLLCWYLRFHRRSFRYPQSKKGGNQRATAKGAETYKHQSGTVCCIKIIYMGIKLMSPCFSNFCNIASVSPLSPLFLLVSWGRYLMQLVSILRSKKQNQKFKILIKV